MIKSVHHLIFPQINNFKPQYKQEPYLPESISNNLLDKLCYLGDELRNPGQYIRRAYIQKLHIGKKLILKVFRKIKEDGVIRHLIAVPLIQPLG